MMRLSDVGDMRRRSSVAFELPSTAVSKVSDGRTHACVQVLFLLAALSTCDPGDIMQTIKAAQQHKVRVSIVGLAAQVHICTTITQVFTSCCSSIEMIQEDMEIGPYAVCLQAMCRHKGNLCAFLGCLLRSSTEAHSLSSHRWGCPQKKTRPYQKSGTN